MKRYVCALSFLFFVASLFSGCATPPVEDAFSGDLTEEKSNRVIADYCVTCHVHKDFQAEDHMKRIVFQYSNPKYTEAKACTTCHSYSKSFWLETEHRGTIHPDDENR